MSVLISFITILFLTSCGAPEQGSLEALSSGVVHGEGPKADNRSETTIEDVLRNNNILYDEAKMLLELSRSTAGMVVVGDHVTKFEDGSMMAKKTLKTFKKLRSLCDEERFGEQYSLPICTGFLVAPDLLVTAGHCVNKINFYKRSWIFGYDQSMADDNLPTFDREYVYHTKEVLEWEENKQTRRDFALVRLDRAVTVARPLKVRSFGEALVRTPVAIIGHPNGLPTKISAGAEILDASEPNAYKTNLDSFGGNSGSPVFNLITGEVEGILVSGDRDFMPNVLESCFNVNTKKDVDGAEFVAKISMVNLSRYLSHNDLDWNF